MTPVWKRFSAMFLAAVMATSLTACGDKGTDAKTDNGQAQSTNEGGERTFTASGETLNVGVQTNIISVPTVYAEEKGYFDELGLDVNLIVFPTGAPENEGLAAEQLDVASNGLASVYPMASGLCDWIGESDCGSSTVKIYAREGSPILEHKGEIEGKPEMYGSVDTLRGARVLGPTSTMEHWAAASYFNQFGLVSGVDYEYLNMDRAAAAQAIFAGEGDIFVATDVDYCKLMEENGMVEIANCEQATGTDYNNGFLARKDVIENRYDDVVLFLRGMYKAAEELEANPELRYEFSLKYYSENGKPADEDDVKLEAELRPFLTPDDFTAPDFELGSGALKVGSFFASIGTLEEDQTPLIEEAINVGPLQDAFGITVNAATLS